VGAGVIDSRVLGCLYPLIADYASEPGFDAVARRLDDLELDREAVQAIGRTYAAATAFGIGELDAYDHLLVPAWLLAVASSSVGSRQFEADLREALLDAAVERLSGGPPVTVVFNGWSLGTPAEQVQGHVAAHPVTQLLPVDITLAYRGLVEHVQLIQEDRELACNAVVWRVAGVLEALTPVAKPTLQAGVDYAFKVIGGLEHCRSAREIGESFADLTRIRNALTHLVDEGSGHSFKSVQHHGFEFGEVLAEAATLVIFELERRALLDVDSRAAAAALDGCMNQLSWIATMT
jgi:hypothetical protein